MKFDVSSEARGQRTEVRNSMEKGIKSIKDLKIYTTAYKLAMGIYEISKKFPKEEIYSLTDQIRRSSRSVAINIREGYAKRRYEQVFIRHLNDAMGSSEETRGWLDFSLDCKYVNNAEYQNFDREYDELNAMLYALMRNWKTYDDKI